MSEIECACYALLSKILTALFRLSPYTLRRFNVAVTRGMALCVIVGQPQLLYADPHWREMIRFCVKHGELFTENMLLNYCLAVQCRHVA